MTVAQLIAALQAQDPRAEVLMDTDPAYSSVESVDERHGKVFLRG